MCVAYSQGLLDSQGLLSAPPTPLDPCTICSVPCTTHGTLHTNASCAGACPRKIVHCMKLPLACGTALQPTGQGVLGTLHMVQGYKQGTLDMVQSVHETLNMWGAGDTARGARGAGGTAGTGFIRVPPAMGVPPGTGFAPWYRFCPLVQDMPPGTGFAMCHGCARCTCQLAYCPWCILLIRPALRSCVRSHFRHPASHACSPQCLECPSASGADTPECPNVPSQFSPPSWYDAATQGSGYEPSHLCRGAE